MSSDLQGALLNVAEEVQRQYPELSREDLRTAFTIYREYFLQAKDDPPVSPRLAMDELLLALWDVIVDREMASADTVADLEAHYAAAFDTLASVVIGDATADTLVAVPTSVAEATTAPAPVLEEATQSLDSVAQNDPQEQIYTVKISLDGSQPEIWRRVLIPANVPQTELHYILQAAMGWRGSEQFQFLPPQDRELPSSGEPTLADLLPKEGDDCGYEFDRGTTWYHHLELESIGTPEGRRRYPVCIAGQRACPPEDIGGLKAYEEMLERMKDPTQSEYREMNGWLTQDFNPASFNIEQANLRLSRHGQVSFQAVV